MKSFGVPLLVLGGGGYTIRNVARCWCYETGILLDQPLEDKLPLNPYYEYYGPDHRLHIQPSNMENQNSKEHMEKVRNQLLEVLSHIPAVPSTMSMQERPVDAIPQDGKEPPEEDPDQRPRPSKGNPEASAYDSEGEDDDMYVRNLDMDAGAAQPGEEIPTATNPAAPSLPTTAAPATATFALPATDDTAAANAEEPTLFPPTTAPAQPPAEGTAPAPDNATDAVAPPTPADLPPPAIEDGGVEVGGGAAADVASPVPLETVEPMSIAPCDSASEMDKLPPPEAAAPAEEEAAAPPAEVAENRLQPDPDVIQPDPGVDASAAEAPVVTDADVPLAEAPNAHMEEGGV